MHEAGDNPVDLLEIIVTKTISEINESVKYMIFDSKNFLIFMCIGNNMDMTCYTCLYFSLLEVVYVVKQNVKQHN